MRGGEESWAYHFTGGPGRSAAIGSPPNGHPEAGLNLPPETPRGVSCPHA